MSNDFQTLATGLAELKDIYDGPLKDQFNEDVPFYRAAEKVTRGWSGNSVIRPLRTRRNQGIGAGSDGGNLPSIGRQTTDRATINAKLNWLRFGVTAAMIKSSQSREGSFVEAATYELERGYDDLMNDVNRQYLWDGSGDLAQVNTAASGSTSLVIKGRESTEAALKFIDVGMVIDIYSGSTLGASSVTINAISGAPSDSTATLTLSAPVTASANDILVRANAGVSSEIQGVLYALDGGTSTIYGIDRSTRPQYQGNSQDAGGLQLTLDRLQTSYNEGRRRGGAKYSAIYSDFDSERFYQKLLTSDKRYVNEVKGDGGFGNKDKMYLSFNGVPWVSDKDCPQRVLMLPSEAFKNYVLCDMEFGGESGTMYIPQSDVDAFEVRIRYFANLFNDQPSACAVMKNYISP